MAPQHIPLAYTAGMVTLHTALLLLGTLTATAQGPQQPVYRCHGSHGETVFSGIPCRDRSDLRPRTDGDGGFGEPGTIGHCAESAADVRDGVAAAFDDGDVNHLARLFLWRGYGSRAAYSTMAKLASMLKMPLAGLSLVSRPHAQWWKQDAITPAETQDLRVELALPGMGDSREVRRFPVVQRGDCYWLQYVAWEAPDFP